VKQAKDILAMNRVNFKGVVEKDELLKYVTRLWKQDQQSQTGTAAAAAAQAKKPFSLLKYIFIIF
jgi:hypothetical protein